MSQIKKLGDSKYLIRVSKGTGNRRTQINITFRGTLKKARELARDKETLLDGGLSPQSVLTFEKYLQLWLAAIKKKVAPRTLDGYEGYIKRYAEKPLGQLMLVDIRAHHIQDIYNTIDKSPTTVRNLHAALNACFSYAVRKEYLRSNPCRHTDRPAKSRKEIQVLTHEEAKRFIDVCREKPNGTIFEFALETGMRPEEYLALRWRDLNGREASIQQIVQYNRRGGGYYFDKPKTAKSRRMISISENMRLRIVHHRIEQNEHRLAMKGTWFNHDLIFPNEIGRPFSLANITNRYFRPIADACELGKHITLYSLRHSCATLLLMARTNPKVVADRLGHSSVTMTLDTYSHVLPHIQDDATNQMDRILRFKK